MCGTGCIIWPHVFLGLYGLPPPPPPKNCSRIGVPHIFDGLDVLCAPPPPFFQQPPPPPPWLPHDSEPCSVANPCPLRSECCIFVDNSCPSRIAAWEACMQRI